MCDRRIRRAARSMSVAAFVLVMTACGVVDFSAADQADAPTKTTVSNGTTRPPPAAPTSTAATHATLDETTVPETPQVEFSGMVVSAVDDSPLAGVALTTADGSTRTDDGGRFSIAVTPGETVTVTRPAWIPTTLMIGESSSDTSIELTPFTVRGLRVSAEVASDPVRFDALLAMTDGSAVNTLVFDTKDENDRVLYQSNVELAQSIGAVEPTYDPAGLLAKTQDRGLYAVTRIVTFEDRLWTDAVPEAQLAADWVDAANQDNWEYPLALATEACELGFDEIQFDYVRFPEGRAAEQARDLGRVPATIDERAEVIGSFLAEARTQLATQGCAVSAAIFGVVMSSPTDEGIGQTVEAVSASVDAVSPMIYPSHYGPGWIGLEDPNEHPGPVVAHALDGGIPRLSPATSMRPWLQAFEYRPDQVKAQINEVEKRGGGWILWNFYGRYNEDAIPTEDEL